MSARPSTWNTPSVVGEPVENSILLRCRNRLEAPTRGTGGQKQRVPIARAPLGDREALLLAESTGARGARRGPAPVRAPRPHRRGRAMLALGCSGREAVRPMVRSAGRWLRPGAA